MIRVLILAALALAACQSAPPPVETPMETTGDWWRAYYGQPQLVRLPDGRSMTLLCRGSGSPTVIFESGLGGGAPSWRFVQPAIAKTTRACSYDRAGIGGSAEGPASRNVSTITSDLEALVKAARLKGPFVLVGHSMGSYSVQMFAYRNPDKVAGVVLVDPSSDNQGKRFAEAAPAMQALQDAEMDTPKKCVAALTAAPLAPTDALYPACIGAPPPDMPADLHPRHVASGQDPTHARTRLAEYEGFEPSSAKLIAARRALTGVPLIVLTAQNTTNLPQLAEPDQAAAAKVWFDLHSALARLSDKGQHRIVEDSGHAIQREKPAVVIAAIEEIMATARGR